MKLYITRRGRPDFVCDAPTIADGIVLYWAITRETPRATYRIHFGRRRKTRVVSSAIAYWALESDMRAALYDVLEETSTEKQFHSFCDHAVTAAELLGF